MGGVARIDYHLLVCCQDTILIKVDALSAHLIAYRPVLNHQKILACAIVQRMKFRHDYADLEYVHCPLANDGITIDRIISVFYYHGATD